MTTTQPTTVGLFAVSAKGL